MIHVQYRGALILFALAALVTILGVWLAARSYPSGFDWAYTVISRLASHRRNPEGALWLAAAMGVAMVLLWPVVSHLDRAFRTSVASPRPWIRTLQVGLVAGALLSVEGILDLRLSSVVYKAHEVLAIFAFAGFYGGVVGLHLFRIRHRNASVWPVTLVLLPLLAVGLTQVALYFDQRDLGWVDTAWREMGVPIWLSFAFWQWAAVTFLALGLGALVFASPAKPGEHSVV